MNSNRQFDEHIKEQFSNFSPDVHPRIWEKIMAEKDKRRPAGFWISLFSGRNKLLVLGLFITLSTGGAFLYFNNDLPKNTQQTVTENKDTRPADKSGITENDQNANPQLNTHDVAANSKTPATDNSATSSNQTFLSTGGIKGSIISPSTQSDEDENSTNNSSKRNRNHVTGLGSVLVNTTAASLDADEYEGQGTLLGRLTYNAEKYTVKRKTGKPETVSFSPIVFLPDCPTFEKDAAGNKKYFEFYAGPDYAFRSLQDTGNSAYLQKRKESTTFKSGFSAGLRYTRVFNNSMSIRGGVNYSQINEKFTYNQGNIVQVTYIINSNGDTVGSFTTTGTRYKTTINKYRSIDIPVVVGYELGNGRLHANINAGAVINIYSWQNGDVLDTAGKPVSITTGKSSTPYQFKTNAGVGFIGAVSVYYKLNDRLHIMAEPYFRYNFSPMNKESITLKQKYQTAGLRLGIRLDLK